MASKYAIETIFKAVDKVTAPIQKIDKQMGKLGGTGKMVNTALKNGFADAEKSLGKFTNSMKTAVKGLEVAAVAAASAFAANGVKNAIEYEQSLAKLSTIANDLPMDETAQKILKVSNTMHVAATDITESTYSAISSGIEATKAVDFVTTATKAAKAGFAETGVAIDGLTNIMNAYGMSADNAMKIADQMLVTQNLGKATFTDMAKGMGQVAPLAASLNVKTEELFASIAALTNAGIQTPQAITGIKAALSNIMKPTTQASKLAEQLGLDFSAAGLQSKGWVGFLEDVKNATKGDAAMMATLFGSVEALNSISVLTGKGAGKFTESLEAMTSMAGITEKAFDKMMKTPQERLAGLKNKFTNAGIKLGQALLPALERIADRVEVFADRLSDFDFSKFTKAVDAVADGLITLINVILTFRTPTGVIITVVTKIIQSFSWLIQKVTVLGKLFGWITTGIILTKGAMIATVAVMKVWTAITTVFKGAQIAFIALTKGQAAATAMLDGATKGVVISTKIWRAVLGAGAWIKKFVKQVVIAKGTVLAQAAVTKIVTVATTAWSVAQSVLNALFVASPIGWIIIAIGALIAVIVVCVKHWDAISAAISFAWEKVKQFASFIWDKLCAAFSFLGEKISEAAGIIKGVFLSAVNSVWQPIQRIIDAFTDGGIIGGIRQIGASILQFALKPILTVMDVLSNLPVIGEKIGDVRNWIQEKIDAVGYTPQANLPESPYVLPFPTDNSENSNVQPTPQAFTPYAAAQVNTQHTEINRSEMQISLERGLNAQVYGKAPGITVQTQKTGTFD